MLSRDAVHRNTEFIVMQPLNTIDTEMQCMCNVFTGCCAQNRNTPFRVMQPFNTMETEMLYVHNVITGCCAKKHSIYHNATI